MRRAALMTAGLAATGLLRAQLAGGGGFSFVARVDSVSMSRSMIAPPI